MDKWDHWNYRVIHSETNGSYWIAEVYYDKDDNILSRRDFKYVFGTSFNDLELDLEQMAEALNKPVLSISDMPKEEKDV